MGVRRQILTAWLIPGGLLLLLAAALLQGGFVPLAGPAINFYAWASLIASFLIAGRFRSTRVLFALVTLFLAQRAIVFFAGPRLLPHGPGRIAFEAVAFILPLNFILITYAPERGFNFAAIVPRLGVLFLESVFVAVICRTGEVVSPWFLRIGLPDANLFGWTKLPQPALLVLALAFAATMVAAIRDSKPIEIGIFWSLLAAFLALQTGGLGRVSTGYFATAALILAASIVESSYALAYHDELTTLPSRRSFHDALLGLEHPYTVAAVDIDHFKSVNDTYGHDTGDQVLRMVARKLAAVTGGGQAYRVGGEEFTVLFPGKLAKEVAPHLELLRATVAEASFRVRNMPERRSASRGPDRRTAPTRRAKLKLQARPLTGNLSVTVSIGVAASSEKESIDHVIEAADQALYRAKRAGRNRIELAGGTHPAARRSRRSIA